MEFLFAVSNTFLIISFILFLVSGIVIIINKEILNVLYIILLNILMFAFILNLNIKIESTFPETIKIDSVKYERINKDIIYSKYKVINKEDTIYFNNIQIKQTIE